MTDAEKIAFKHSLKKFALDSIGKRIATANEAMQQAQEAANSEEKSSAGDKYETARAMGHLQKDMYARQLAESQKELAALQNIPTDTLCREGRAGALLRGEDLSFFISAGLGRHTIDDQTIVFLSPQAPLAKLLHGKRPGDEVAFNNKPVRIRDVF